MKAQALGRGLGALLGEIDEAYENEVPQKLISQSSNHGFDGNG